jgi:hypothetical protein
MSFWNGQVMMWCSWPDVLEDNNFIILKQEQELRGK